MGDVTKMKIDDISEARHRRELEEALYATLEKTAPNVNLDSLGKDVLPTLVSSMCGLLKAAEDEATHEALHAKHMQKNPAIKPRQKFNSLHWLASHMMRHNPKHVPTARESYHVPDSTSLNAAQVQEVKHTFRLKDRGDGTISVGALRDILRGQGRDFSEGGMRLLLERIEVDESKTGFVDFGDYLKVIEGTMGKIEQKKKQSLEEIKLAVKKEFNLMEDQFEIFDGLFTTYDRNGDGTISHAECFQLLKSLGDFSEDDVRTFFNAVDLDGSGRIDFAEFVTTNMRAMTQANKERGTESKGNKYVPGANSDIVHVVIKAELDDVWNIVGKWDDLSWLTSEPVTTSGEGVDATRQISGGPVQTCTESIKHSYSFSDSINGAVVTICVKSEDEMCALYFLNDSDNPSDILEDVKAGFQKIKEKLEDGSQPVEL